MHLTPINLADKLERVSDHWHPHIVGRFNGHDIMVVKVQGEFVWHSHPDTDDFFMVLRGALTIDMPEGSVSLGPGEIYVVPQGVQHRPRAEVETELMILEPAGTPNTGNTETAVAKVRI